MVVCIVAIFAVKFTPIEKILNAGNPVFWLEFFLLWAFGVSWFVKGDTLLRD